MIRFPKHHIATSVINRIMNVADELEADAMGRSALVNPSAPPVGGNVLEQGAALDQALQAPPGETPGLEAAPDAGASVAGKPLLATMLDPK